MKPGCESCKSKSIGDQCKHCWSCGGDNHISRYCSKNPRNQKGNYRGLQERQRVASEAQTMSYHCNGCGKPEHNQTFLQCKQCKSVRYCSYQCQKKSWNTEKPYIRPISQLLDDSDNLKLTAAYGSAIPYDGWVKVEFP